MTSGKDAYARKAGKYFDEGLKERPDVFALMGKVRWELHIHSKESSSTTAENLTMLSSYFLRLLQYLLCLSFFCVLFNVSLAITVIDVL